MRRPEYLSPSQLALWETNRDEYYLRHLAEYKAPKIPQTRPMAVGSSFDAYVKSHLFEALNGKGSDPKYEFDTIFCEQVEVQNRDEALKSGKHVFDSYLLSGAYEELLSLLKESKCAPRFEFKVTGTIEDIPLVGKPDLRFIHKDGAQIILDWKVSGYYSKSAVSPCKNYRLIRDGWSEAVAPSSRGSNQAHKNYKPINWNGFEIHSGWLEEANPDWADQLALYAWLLDEPVGCENVIVCIDQIVTKPLVPQPLLRITNHRARISAEHQRQLLSRLKACWSVVLSGHIFQDLTLEESIKKCELLDQQATLANLDTPEFKFLNEVSREQRFWR
jgi:hypothetical protein